MRMITSFWSRTPLNKQIRSGRINREARRNRKAVKYDSLRMSQGIKLVKHVS